MRDFFPAHRPGRHFFAFFDRRAQFFFKAPRGRQARSRVAQMPAFEARVISSFDDAGNDVVGVRGSLLRGVRPVRNGLGLEATSIQDFKEKQHIEICGRHRGALCRRGLDRLPPRVIAASLLQSVQACVGFRASVRETCGQANRARFFFVDDAAEGFHAL